MTQMRLAVDGDASGWEPSLIKSTERTISRPSTPHAQPLGSSPFSQAERLLNQLSQLADHGLIGSARTPARASSKFSGADWCLLSPRTEDGRHVV